MRRLPVSFVAPAGGGESDPVVVTVPRPQLWSLHQPQLYRVTVTPQGAAAWRPLVVRTGLRDVTVRGREVLLNGRPLRRLPGINRHHDYPGLGRTVPDGLARRDLRELRARGYRIFRPGHYPSTPAELDAADSLGLLVIEEINVSSLAGRVLNSQPVREFASAQLTRMIRRDRGHPSVIAWSVGNENRVDEPGGVDYVRDIVGLGKSLDATRLYTQVSALHGRDPTYQFQDLVSVNAYAGWYAGRAAGVAPLLDQIARVTRGRPMLVAEYGAEADPHYGVDGKGSERYQSCLVDEYRRVLAPKRGLMAQMVWTFTDFWRDPENGGGNPRQIQPFSSKGLVSYDRRPKLAWRTAFSPVRIVEPHRVVVPLGRYSSTRVPIVVEAVGRRTGGELRITPPRGFSVTPERVRFTVGAQRRVIWVTLDGLLPVGNAHASGVVRAIVNRTTEAHPQSLTVAAQGSAGPSRVGCR